MTVATIEEWESKVLIQSGSSFLLRNHMKTGTISCLNKEIQKPVFDCGCIIGPFKP